MKLCVLKDERDFAENFIEQIIELDRANMEGILNEAGIEFPEAKRRLGFKRNPTIIVAETAGKLIGYLEYTRSWNERDDIYISSIQIDKRYRHSKLILRLIGKLIESVETEDFRGFETNVQKNNFQAVKLFRKIGFEFEENPRNPASWLLRADRRILSESPVRLLFDKWRERDNRD